MKLVNKPDGTIVWANNAFCIWSQYTLSELQGMTWMQLSVPDANLRADIEELKKLDDYSPIYTVKKQYIPKGSRPEWGILSVMRYPVSGDIDFCLCTWEPLKNGTAAAFELAMDCTKHVGQSLDEVITMFKKSETLTAGEKLGTAIVEWSLLNPKTATIVLLVILSLNPLPIITTWVTRLGWLPAQPVEIRSIEPKAEKEASYELRERFSDLARR